MKYSDINLLYQEIKKIKKGMISGGVSSTGSSISSGVIGELTKKVQQINKTAFTNSNDIKKLQKALEELGISSKDKITKDDIEKILTDIINNSKPIETKKEDLDKIIKEVKDKIKEDLKKDSSCIGSTEDLHKQIVEEINKIKPIESTSITKKDLDNIAKEIEDKVKENLKQNVINTINFEEIKREIEKQLQEALDKIKKIEKPNLSEDKIKEIIEAEVGKVAKGISNIVNQLVKKDDLQKQIEDSLNNNQHRNEDIQKLIDKSIEDLDNKLKDEIKKALEKSLVDFGENEKLKNQIKDEIGKAINKETIKDDLKNELKNDIKEALGNGNLKNDIKQELSNDLKQELDKSLKKEEVEELIKKHCSGNLIYIGKEEPTEQSVELWYKPLD